MRADDCDGGPLRAAQALLARPQLLAEGVLHGLPGSDPEPAAEAFFVQEVTSPDFEAFRQMGLSHSV